MKAKSAGTERANANPLEGPPRRAQPGAGAEFESGFLSGDACVEPDNVDD
jgi:hypothetical protein